MDSDLTEKEAAIYDRQIRLWGVEAQKRMQNSRVLFCGFRATNAEVGAPLNEKWCSCSLWWCVSMCMATGRGGARGEAGRGARGNRR